MTEKENQQKSATRRAAQRRRQKQQKLRNRFSVILVTAVVVFLGIVFWTKNADSQESLADLTQKEEELKKQYEEEQKRADELEERRIYIQTPVYIEEMAKRLGYVYPNEIIFKPVE